MEARKRIAGARNRFIDDGVRSPPPPLFFWTGLGGCGDDAKRSLPLTKLKLHCAATPWQNPLYNVTIEKVERGSRPL